MLTIHVPAGELYDEIKNEFVYTPEIYLKLEHSLLSLSKWESKWKKPFLDDTVQRSEEESLDYIRMMTIGSVNESVYTMLTQTDINMIQLYINDPMTATTIKKDGRKGNNGSYETNETIYCAMVEAGIPFECEKWHLNRLLTLIAVYAERQKSGEKMSNKDIYKQQKALNKARRAGIGSKG